MAAYSTLLSLENLLNQILNHDRFSTSPYEKDQIISLVNCVVSFQAFLEDFPERAKNLETRIRDVAAVAEDILEWCLHEQIQPSYRYNKRIAIPRENNFQFQLQNVKDEMDSIATQVMEIKNSMKIKDKQLDDDFSGASSSSQVADTGEINAAGFKKYVIEIKEKLCRWVAQLQVVTIFSTGGFGKTTLARNAFDDPIIMEIKSGMEIKDKQLDDPSVPASSSSQAADTTETNVVGLKEDLKEIKKKLSGRTGEAQLQIVSILGMGGIGKTTIARNAYSDELIKEYFQIRVWITVSQDYSKKRIIFILLDSLKEFNSDWRKESRSEEGNESQATIIEMELKVSKILRGRRFLIVMDDIWSTKVLDDVRHLFPNTNNGSRIMLTTRLREVATYNANISSLSHEMRLMDPEQSWNLLRQKVFTNQDSDPYNLESIGREIAKSCGGLPLAIVVIAGLLSTMSQTVASWEGVATNISSFFATEDGRIEKIVSLSYSHLPHHLRPCFLYMGGFPKDNQIKVTDVIKLWIAESFVKPVASKEFEDTAKKYLEDLVDRNLILVTERKSNGKIRFVGLHETVREMCIKISQEEKFLIHPSGSRLLEESMNDRRQRRISISYKSYDSCNMESSTIRTIIYCNDELRSFGSFRLLKILYLLRTRSHETSLCDQLFKLSHLSYLAFWYSHTIPRAISNLQSLQTLIIKRNNASSLPHEIWNMLQLRHLIISKIRLPITSTATSPLEKLQTLGKIENLKCLESTLNLIPNLRKLWLSYSKGSGELLFNNLALLSRLEKLHLELGFGWHTSGKRNLAIPSSLKQLTLTGWGDRGTYLEIVGPFPSLQVLKLKRFDFMPQEWRTTDGEFPQLKYLLIEESDITQWDIESSHFPALKTLSLHSCPGLTELPDCTGDIPGLELIEVRFCRDSLADSAKRIQEEARDNGDEVLQVRCIDCQPSNQLMQPSLYEEAMRKSWLEQFVEYRW